MYQQKENLIGERFGMLTVVEAAPSKNGKAYWLCECDCGGIKTTSAANLKRGDTKSCGCLAKRYQLDNHSKLEGMTFGRLKVIKYIGSSKYKCICSCGNKTIVSTYGLTSGGTKSCGCLQKEIVANKHYKHGDSRSNLYAVFVQMHQRCENPNNKNYHYYGHRGIKVCETWKEWLNFKAWALANGYQKGLTIDRIDPNGNYYADNCRWITIEAQQKNRRPR